jgi:3-phenylpropionate/trans-cinnamate dioxygenase ferredoxin subunit
VKDAPPPIQDRFQSEPADQPAAQAPSAGSQTAVEPAGSGGALKENEFRTAELLPGSIKLVHVHGDPVAVYNVAGEFYATSDECTHVGGPLSEGELNGDQVTCPWHGSCFNVKTGVPTCPPARQPVKTYKVTVEAGVVRVEA